MTYEIGQQIGVCYSSLGSRPNRYKIGTVVKVSKTRVTVRTATIVENIPKGNDESFSIQSGRRIGDKDSWYPAQLVTLDIAQQGQAYAKKCAADSEKFARRTQMLSKLDAAVKNDEKFRELLAELNSREYLIG